MLSRSDVGTIGGLLSQGDWQPSEQVRQTITDQLAHLIENSNSRTKMRAIALLARLQQTAEKLVIDRAAVEIQQSRLSLDRERLELDKQRVELEASRLELAKAADARAEYTHRRDVHRDAELDKILNRIFPA
jgi:hypothetical protein